MKHIKEYKEYLNDNFWQWFGDSQIVDSSGEPLIVYHGTTGDFDSFNLDNQDKFGDFGAGFYFTGEKDVANYYTISKNDSSVMSVYLSIQKPFVIDLYNEKITDISSYEKLKFPREYETEINQLLSENDYFSYKKINKLIGDKKFTDTLIRSGHDGVIINRTATHNDGTGDKDNTTPNHEIVAFYPEQIKSATGNNGYFNKHSKNINEKIENKIEKYLSESTFDDMPLIYKKGLMVFMYEGEPVEWSYYEPITDWNADKNVNILINDYSKEKGKVIFEYGEVPTQLIIDKVTEWIDDEGYYKSFDEWHQAYQSTNTAVHDDSIFPLIVSDDEEEYIYDGWHRFNYYLYKGYNNIPIIRI